MSVELEVYLNRSSLPSVQKWNKALKELGFPLKLDETIDLGTHSGYLPARLKSEETGFEFDVFQVHNLAALSDSLGVTIGDRDTVVTFRLAGDETELVADPFLYCRPR